MLKTYPLNLYNTSFTPEGDWFIFEGETGKTIRRGFRNRMAAINFILYNNGDF